MKSLLGIILFSSSMFCSLPSFAQKEQQEVIQTIQQLFDGMKKGDSLMVRKIMDHKARLLTIVELEAKVSIQEISVDQFVEAVGSPHDEIWDERITDYDIKIDGRLATAWTPYEFYLGDSFSHCGVNAFHLYKSIEGWKIIEIADTRRTTNCLQ